MKDNTAIIKLKLNSIIDNITDDLIQLSIDEVSQTIKNYCNISSIPNELSYVHANMVVDLVNYYYSKGVGLKEGVEVEIDTGEGDITSITLGDMKLSIGSISGTSNDSKDSSAHKNSLDNIVMNYTEQLNQFREMYG